MRLSHLFACAVAFTVTASATRAQTWNNYTGVGGTNWSNAANWVGGVAPVSSVNTSLTFTSTPPQTVPPALAFQPTGGYLSTNDATAPFVLNSITLDGYGSPSLTTPGIVITSSVASGGISFQGTNPTISQNGSGSVLFANGVATADIIISSSDLTIGGMGIGHTSFNGTITGSGNLNIFQTGTTPMFTGAQVILAPATANTFTGNVRLSSGNLALTAAAGSNPLGNAGNTLGFFGGFGNATLRGLGGTVTVPNPVFIQQPLTLVGTQSFIFTNTIGGAFGGGIRVSFSEARSATFQSGVVDNGSLLVEGQGAAANSVILNMDGILNLSGYTVNYGNFTLDNSVTTVVRLNNNAALNLNNASFTLVAGAAAIAAESVASTNLQGGALFTLTPSATRAVQFFGGSLNRVGLATFQVNTLGVGLTLGGVPGSPGNATMQFDNLTAVDNINGVLPYGFANIQNGPLAVNTAQTLVRYDSTRGIVPLNLTTDYVSNTTVAFNTINVTPGVNYRLGLPKNTVEGSTNNPRINSLLIEANGASTSDFGGAIYGTGTITLTSGALATTLVGGNIQPSFLGTVISKNIEFGPQGYLHAHADTALLGNLSGVNGLVKSGSGSLLLTGNNAGLHGLAVNNGNVVFSRAANLGSMDGAISLGVGQGTGSLILTPNSQFESPVDNMIATNQVTTLSGGAGSLGVTLANTSLVWNGVVTGPGRLVKNGLGTLTLTAPNTYSGDTTIVAGALIANSDPSLGNPASNVILSGASAATPAILQIGSSITTNRNLLVTSTAAFGSGVFVDTAIGDFTINGNIGGSQTGTPFFKSGEGSLTLTANNSINGAIALGESVPTRRVSTDRAQTGGPLTLRGNGALATATSYTLNNGTQLVLDNGMVPNFNRISSSSVTANGSEFRLIGNPSSSVFEHVGRDGANGFISNSLANTITLDQQLGGPVSANLVLTGLSGTGITFFRGTNLGNSTGGSFTRVILTTPPTLINNLIPGTFFAGSATSAPTDFATYLSSANGVEALPIGSYTPFPSTGGNATATHIATSNNFLVGSVASNALKLNGGANIFLGTNTLTFNNNAGLILTTGGGFSAIADGTVAFVNTPARISVESLLNITSNITVNAGGLNKFGPGTLLLTATTVSGGYQISQGTVQLLAAAAFSNNQALTISNSGTLDLNNNGTVASPITAGSLIGFGTIAIGTGAFANSGTNDVPAAFGGGFTGSGTFIHNYAGANVPTYNGQSPGFTGSVQILRGSLILDTATAFGETGTIQLGNTSGSQAVTLILGPGVAKIDKSFSVPAGSTGVVTLSTGAAPRVSMITGAITLGRALTLTGAISSAASVPGATTLSGAISDANIVDTGSIVWTGGNYSLTAANTFTGGIVVDNPPTPPDITLLRNVLGIGSNTALGTGSITFANKASASFRADSGPRTVANSFNFAAATTPNTIGFVGVNDLTFTSSVVSLGSATRTFEVISLGKTTFTGQFTGTAAINKTGAGTLKLANAQSNFSGGFILSGGSLSFGASSFGTPVTRGPIGTGPLTIAGSNVNAEDGPQLIENTVVVATDFAVDGMNDITMGGIIDIGMSIKRIVITNTGATNFTNTISGSGGGGIIKDGVGALTLTGNNSTGYPGGTTVTQGKLVINSQIGSGLPVAGMGMTTVETGARIEGNGRLGSDVDVESGGEFGGGVASSPSIGTLTLTGGTVTIASGARYLVGVKMPGLGSAVDSGGSSGGTPGAPVNNNYINQTAGTLVLQPGSLIRVDVTDTTFPLLGVNYSYNIMKLSTTQVGFTFPPGNVSFVGGDSYAFQNITLSGDVNGFIYFNFTPTPEPAALLALAALALGTHRRRKW